MSNFVSMMPVSSIVKFLNANKFSNDVNVYDAVSICEFGMTAVLKQVAVSQLGQYEPGYTPEYNVVLKKVVELQNMINATLTDEQKIINEDLEAAQGAKELIECDQYYIDGFLAGYKFLREISKMEGLGSTPGEN